MSNVLKKKLGQPSWQLKNNTVELWLTRKAGMMAPVTFRLPRGRNVQPFAVAPWAEEKGADQLIGLLAALRGDFFCAPFGGNGVPWRGVSHPPHGSSSNQDWQLESISGAGGTRTLHASFRGGKLGRIDKRLTLRAGEPVVYCENILSGYSGPTSIGTHPCFKFPDREGAARISVGGWKRGQVLPFPFEQPTAKGYSCLKTGARFSSLEKVPLGTGGTTDLTRYPARRGFDDLVMLLGDGQAPFGWSAMTFPEERYAVLQLKNPRLLHHTILWHSNGGRHYAPWDGRHVNVLGVEEVTSYFHVGLAESARPNSLRRAGFATTLALSPKRPLRVPHIFAVADLPRGFDIVADVRPDAKGITLVAGNRKRAKLALDVGFLAV